MPNMTGLELQQELNRRGWPIPTIFITGHATVSSAVAALRAGAFDFIEKPLRDDALIESIARARGQREMTHQERLQLVETESRAALLTPREREVLDLVVAGEPNKIIARRLGISFRTVEVHRSHILEKMQARSISHLIRMAILLESRKSTGERLAAKVHLDFSTITRVTRCN
jgi:two-component system response regulator FixJ